MFGALLGAAGSLFGGGGGAAAPVSSGTAPTNVVFGSVNYKSPGAGDSGKSAGASGEAFASPASVPVWVWIVGALGVVGLLLALFLPRKK